MDKNTFLEELKKKLTCIYFVNIEQYFCRKKPITVALGYFNFIWQNRDCLYTAYGLYYRNCACDVKIPSGVAHFGNNITHVTVLFRFVGVIIEHL